MDDNKKGQGDTFRLALGVVLVVAGVVMYVTDPERLFIAVFVTLAGLAMAARSWQARQRHTRGELDLLDGPPGT